MARPELLESIREVIAKEFAIAGDRITGATRLCEDLDLDSLDIVAMAGRVEEEMGAQIADDDLADLQCVGDVVRAVERSLGAGVG